MANRREFLQVSATAALLSVSPTLIAAAATTAARPNKVLVDARHAASLRFGADFAAQGVALHTMADGDLTRFWRDELSVLWREAPLTLAGVTETGPLFCLEQLGRQYGLRVAQCDEIAGGLVAWLIVPRQLVMEDTGSLPAQGRR